MNIKYQALIKDINTLSNESINKLNPSNVRAKLKLCSEAGVLKHGFSKEIGGYGDGIESLCRVHEFIGKTTLDTGLILSISAHIWGGIFPLVCFGSDKQKNQWLLSLLEGKIISGHAITEPNAGSDVKNMSTQAKVFNDGFVLNGHKKYISNAPIADFLIVYARDSNQISAFIVKKSDPGVVFADSSNVEAFKTAPIGEVILNECYIPHDRLLGRSGAGMGMIQNALAYERAFLFAGILGIMEYQLDKVVDYSRMRKIDGQTLEKKQAISHKIADMSVRLETARLWIYHCAKLVDCNKKINIQSSYAKICASEFFLQSSLDAIHIMGAKGLESSERLAQFVIDATASRLFSGSTEIQKNIISALQVAKDGY